MPHLRPRTFCLAVVIITTGWPVISHGQTVELLDALKHQPASMEPLKLTHPYVGTLETVYSRGVQDSSPSEQVLYNLFFNYDAHRQGKANFPRYWTPQQIKNYLDDNSPHGLAVASVDKFSSNHEPLAYGEIAVFQAKLPTVKELSACTLYSQLIALLAQNEPFLTDATGNDEGMQTPMGWRCFAPDEGKSIRVVDVSCDIFQAGKFESGRGFSPSGPEIIDYIIIKEGTFSPIGSH